GVTGQAEVLLRAGYGVVMMDARAHGASEGSTATYGWLERKDTRAVIDRLFQDARQGCLASQYHGTGSPCPLPRHVFALGKAVAARAFPVLLVCDEKDVALPCRHTQMIYDAARGPKQLWVVPHAYHTAALGFYPEEFKRRVLEFFGTYRSGSFARPSKQENR